MTTPKQMCDEVLRPFAEAIREMAVADLVVVPMRLDPETGKTADVAVLQRDGKQFSAATFLPSLTTKYSADRVTAWLELRNQLAPANRWADWLMSVQERWGLIALKAIDDSYDLQELRSCRWLTWQLAGYADELADWIEETYLTDPQRQAPSSPAQRRVEQLTTNEAMKAVLDQYEEHPEMLEWSAQEWANKLGKSKTAVLKSECWSTVMELREATKRRKQARLSGRSCDSPGDG